MTASTKIPSSRANGALVPSGPVPAPRVVGNRRIRTGGVALAVMLLAFGAALSGIALLLVSRTSSYLAVARPVQVGTQLTAADLKTVQLRGGGLTPIPAAEINAVVGLRASVSLVPGTLLAAADLTNKSLISADEAQIGIRASNLPASRLRPGDQIQLVPLQAGASSTTTTYTATVVDVGTPGNDGGAEMHIAVPADLAATLVTLNANGGLGIALLAGH